MRLHPRTMKVQQAQAELGLVINRFSRENGLTDIETLQALTSYLQTSLKYALRAERHPEDPNKKADEE